MTDPRSQQDRSSGSGKRSDEERSTAGRTARAYLRGAAGGLLVGLPLLLTMEMWWAGFTVPPSRMLLFLLFNLGILLILERYSGFRRDFSWLEEIQDVAAAMGIGLLTATGMLYLFGVLRAEMPFPEIAGKILIETFPVSIGVTVAVSQLGKSNPQSEQRKEEAGFWGRMAIAIAGAMFFGLNVAVTEEPVMVALRADWWHILLLLLLSFALSYIIVYAVDFRGEKVRARGTPLWNSVLREGTTTYALSLAVAAYLLWTFGRFDPQTGLAAALYMTVVLGVITSLGSAASTLLF